MRSNVITMVFVLVVFGAIARHYPDEQQLSRTEALEEFLAWVHPPNNDCGRPENIDVVRRWPELIRVRYELPCSPRRSLEALLEVFEGEGVWQVRSGYIGSRSTLDAALQAEGSLEPVAGVNERRRDAAADAFPSVVAPPPANPLPVANPSPGESIRPPFVIGSVPPEIPEEAGRARLFGSVGVELLVDIAADGRPERSRPLRGPDPDLGMRQAAADAIRQYRFEPATLAGEPVRSFTAVEVEFEGLPPESLGWIHRALFRYDIVASRDRRRVERALDRLREGAPFEAIDGDPDGGAKEPGGSRLGSASGLPAMVRRALHESPVGEPIGPLEASGRYYLLRKNEEIYYAIRSLDGPEPSYRIVHQCNVIDDAAVEAAIRTDIDDYLQEIRRRAYVNEASRLMGIRQKRTEIGHLLIHTDVLGDDEIETLGRAVGSAVKAHEQFWDGMVSLRSLDQQVNVYAFARQSDHDRLHRLWAGDSSPASSTEGEYIPTSRILAFPCETTGGHLPIPYVIHEAIHMLNYERVYPEGILTSRWFEEGLASFFGFSRFDARLRIEPGNVRRSSPLEVEGFRIQFDPRTELWEHLRRVRDGGPLALRRLITARHDDPLWREGRSSRAYGSSWTLVHFLMQGEKGRHRKAFREYAALEARGAGGLEGFDRSFGSDLEALEAAWHEYEAGL